MVYFDATGARYGLPTYPYRLAPTRLATVRQLTALGLRPGGQDIAAQIIWRRGKRKGYLYHVDKALPKRTPTPAQRAALDKANQARRTCPTCPTCRVVREYVIPTRWGECIDCHDGGQ
jgi:hypothetical protein